MSITKIPCFDVLWKSGWNAEDVLGQCSPCTQSSKKCPNISPISIVIRARGFGVGAQQATLPYEDVRSHSYGISSAAASHGIGYRENMVHTQPKKNEKKVYNGNYHEQQWSSRRNNQNNANNGAESLREHIKHRKCDILNKSCSL